MTQRKRSKKKIKKQSSVQKIERGFDFGNRQPIVAVADTQFHQALIDAQIVACAYGYDRPHGFPESIPALTLLGTNLEPFKRAFEAFKRWGCEEDGDVVDVNILLKADGTYEMRIGPEADRTMFKIVGQPDLYQPLMVHTWWIKPFDSTHPMLRKLKQYTDTALHPISLNAGLAPTSRNLAEIQPIDGLPRLVKFDLQIIDEESVSGDSRLFFRNKNRKRRHGLPGPKVTPEELCLGRKKILNVAFPVSRERVRRLGLTEHVRSLPMFETVSETQVTQAAINLILSNELGSGRHYLQAENDLPNRIWKHIQQRLETGNDEDLLSEHTPSVIAHQIQLDVRYALMLHDVSTESNTFLCLEEHFRRNGYIDD
jgi:hypothetical protein